MVLEHVKNLEDHFLEILRILKPGGKFVVFTCNYSLFYEFHYQMFLPIFSRPLTKLILKLFGRNTNFIDGVNFITPRKIDKILNKIAMSYDIVWEDTGRNKFIDDLENSAVHSKSFIRFGKIFKLLGLENFLLTKDLFNLLIYVITKNAPH
jgi:SAM-dependent methyltransferase